MSQRSSIWAVIVLMGALTSGSLLGQGTAPVGGVAGGAQVAAKLEIIPRGRPLNPAKVSQGQTEVVLLFNPACVHCHHFDPLFQKWVNRQNGKQVRALYLPLGPSGNPLWNQMARAWMAAEGETKRAEIRQALFRGLHEENQIWRTGKDIGDYLKSKNLIADSAGFSRRMTNVEVVRRVDLGSKVASGWG